MENCKNSTLTHHDCWGKTVRETGEPGISVYQHSLAAKFVCQELLKYLLPETKQLIKAKYAPELTALHDIGKIDLHFQQQCPKWMETYGFQALDLGKVFHQNISQRWLMDEKLGKFSWVAGWHHGTLDHLGIPPGMTEYDSYSTFGDLKQSFFNDISDKSIFQEMCADTLKLIPGDESYVGNFTTLMALTGLVSISDWIASDEKYFPPGKKDMTDKEIKERAKVAVDDIGFSFPEFVSGLSFGEIFADGSGNPMKPNAFQEAIGGISCKPGDVVIMEAPMGMGKTEAALMLAYRLSVEGRNRGIYFALPTQLTSNKIFDRFSQFIAKVSTGRSNSVIKLAHSASWLNDKKSIMEISHRELTSVERYDGSEWFNSNKRALVANFGVGTVDQALMGAINVRHRAVRLAALVGKVVIIDEVHSYDIYTGTILKSMISLLRKVGCTVIVLSATLTEQRRNDLLGIASSEKSPSGYPLITIHDGETSKLSYIEPNSPTGQSSTTRVKITLEPRRGMTQEMIDKAMGVANSGGCVVWFRNTVASAQDTYRKLKSEVSSDGPEIGLLHSRYTYLDRNFLEEKWIGRLGKNGSRPAKGCILVATQVAEQSVDIDADFMLSDLCPMDMLLQRMGRLWRHRRENRRGVSFPEMVVEIPGCGISRALDKTKDDLKKTLFNEKYFVYSHYILMRTWMVLDGVDHVDLPSDIRTLLEKVYCDLSPLPQSLSGLRNEMLSIKEKQSSAADDVMNIYRSKETEAQLKTKDSEEIIVGTRLESYETIPVLLVRCYSSTGSKVSFTLLDGSHHIVERGIFNMEVKRAINKNLVMASSTDELKKSREKDWAGGKWVKEEGYVIRGCVVVPASYSGKFMEASDIPLRYSEEAGLEKIGSGNP